ncbi:hypothetical protein BVY04_00210 [bacterium M21]|nr:hypothetical protein BVY04_00210 [bacterium M21]
MKRIVLLITCLALAGNTFASSLSDDVDWPKFMSRQDIVWDSPPQRFDHGVWHGNGLLGSVMFQTNPKLITWSLGRSDVTAHRRDNNRLPIGSLGLKTVGTIKSGNARLSLWDAEATGEIETDQGSIRFRSFIHTDRLIGCIDLEFTGKETTASIAWLPDEAKDHVNHTARKRQGKVMKAPFPNDPPNPAATQKVVDGISVSVQPRYAGGDYSVAWKLIPLNQENTKQRLYWTIADSFPQTGSDTTAIQTIKEAIATDFTNMVASHRAWWHAYYPKSFVSVPDTKIESYYWIQMHKLASATRANRPVMDLLGPWFRGTGWPRIWWNLNIQTAYLPVYTANHLSEGESLVRMMDRNRKNFETNAKEIWKFDDCATVPHTTCYEGLRGDGSRAPDKYINPGDFTWALHNYYLQYRFSMDHSMITDSDKHALYSLLKKSVNLYQKILIKETDGKLHLPELHSPEIGGHEDNNYNLGLLRWACITLLELNERYDLNDAMAPEWENILANLIEYPTDETGLQVAPGVPIKKAHRHWSHLVMMHPLWTMNWDQPENRELITKSIDHWVRLGKDNRAFKGWSHAAAASLYAGTEDGDKARFHLHAHHDTKNSVMPNGMYIEGSPVIECGLIAARSLHDMLLQSWGKQIKVFPAIPADWKNVAFDDLRAQGAFLLSAERKDGSTQWIRVKSLAGEPCIISHNISGKIQVVTSEGTNCPYKELANGAIELKLLKSESAFIRPAGNTPAMRTRPVASETAVQVNYWGIKK